MDASHVVASQRLRRFWDRGGVLSWWSEDLKPLVESSDGCLVGPISSHAPVPSTGYKPRARMKGIWDETGGIANSGLAVVKRRTGHNFGWCRKNE